jgi:hypothetical protein
VEDEKGSIISEEKGISKKMEREKKKLHKWKERKDSITNEMGSRIK